jgi:hypothetical protein
MATKMCRDFIIRLHANMDSNYPEILRYLMIINAPRVFTLVFNLIKPLIPKATLDKMEIFGPDKEEWKAVIKQKFPIEMIPPYWGGTLQGKDEFCSGSPIWIQGPKDDIGAYMKGW